MFNLFCYTSQGSQYVDEYEMTHSRYASIQVPRHSLTYTSLLLFFPGESLRYIVCALIASFVYTHLLRNKSIVDPYYIPVLLLQYYISATRTMSWCFRSARPTHIMPITFSPNIAAYNSVEFRDCCGFLQPEKYNDNSGFIHIEKIIPNVYQLCHFHFLERGTKSYEIFHWILLLGCI